MDFFAFATMNARQQFAGAKAMTTQTAQFKVGDAVMVLHASRLPAEYPIGAGRIHNITYQSSDGEPLYWIVGFATARTARVLRPSHVPDMIQQETPAKESVVRYEVTVTVTRPVRYDLDAPMDEQEAWAVSSDAKRELEREVLRAMRKLDGDCDCEVMEAVVVTE